MDSAILRRANPNFSIKKSCRLGGGAAPRLEKLDDKREFAGFGGRLDGRLAKARSPSIHTALFDWLRLVADSQQVFVVGVCWHAGQHQRGGGVKAF